MKHVRNLYVVMLCAIFTGACTPSSLTVNTGTPVRTPTEEATPEATLTATDQPSPEPATPTPAATSEPPAAASITPCEQGTILFTAVTRSEENPIEVERGSLYSVCADGTGLRKIISDDELGYAELELSPDGQSLALSGWRLDDTKMLSVASLEDFLFSELVHDRVPFDLQWSADGEYLAYLWSDPTPSETPPETHIEIIHLESGTVSEINLAGLSGFDWSPDSSKAVFGTWIAPGEHSFEEFTAYLGDIECDDATKLCELTGIEEIPNVGQGASWIPGSQTLVSVITKSSENGNNHILVITDIEGNVVQEIDPPLPPNWPRGSPDGRYITFVSLRDLYIVDLDDMSIQQIVFTDRESFHEIASYGWLPPVSD